MILSGNKLKARRKIFQSTKTDHSRFIPLLKVRVCFSRDTLVLTFRVNCGKLLCQVDIQWPFNWFEFIVKYINTILKLCFDFLLSNNVC